MRYAGIIYNDIAAAPGICLSFFTQGCPRNPHCKGCHNPETWSFDGGREFTDKTLASVIKGLTANGILRTLAIMGGEPLCQENLFLTDMVITEVKRALPQVKIYVWTGHTIDELERMKDPRLSHILSTIDYIIDGPYIEEERDITLSMRGSRNQKVCKRGRDF